MGTRRSSGTGTALLCTGLVLLGILDQAAFGSTQALLLASPSKTNTLSRSVTVPVALSPGLAEVLKLAQAKVDPRVIKAYIQQSTIIYSPSAGEVIFLKKLGVPEEILVALMNHGAKLKAEAAQATRASQANPSGTPASSAPGYGSSALAGETVPRYSPYAYSYPGYGYSPYYGYYPYAGWGGLPYTAITSVNSSVPIYGVNGQPVYSGFFLTPDPTAYGIFGTFNNSYATYINGGPVYSAYYVPGYGYWW